MALQRAAYTGVDNILNAYDSIGAEEGYVYSIWSNSNRDLIFQCIVTDADAARHKLELFLKGMEAAGDTGLYMLKFHPDTKGKFIDRKTTVISSSPIRAVDIGEVGEVVQIGNVPSVQNNYKEWARERDLMALPDKISSVMDEKFNSFNDRIAALEKEKENEGLAGIDRYMPLINNALQNPHIGQAIGTLVAGVTSFMGNLVNKDNGMNSVAVNGVPDNGVTDNVVFDAPVNNEVINSSEEIFISPTGRFVDTDVLDRAEFILNKYCELDRDLMKLAELAEKKPDMFKMLLSQLNNL